jgi:DNA polymerase-4
VAVAAPGADRATVLALSAEARRAGITRGMPVNRARKLCPDLIVRPPNPRLYARASRALDEILRHYAPIIEPTGYGHAFLDLTGTGRLFGSAVDVAMKIQRRSGNGSTCHSPRASRRTSW